MKEISGTVVAWVVGIILVLVVGYFAMDLGGVFTEHQQSVNARIAKNTAQSRVTQQVYHPNNVIANVKYFHDACRDVVAKTQQISQLRQEIADVSKQPAGNDPFGSQVNAVEQLRNQLTGLEQARTGVAEQYNSKSAQYIAAPFKDAGLPYRINSPYSEVNCG